MQQEIIQPQTAILNKTMKTKSIIPLQFEFNIFLS